jgi:hypothetical protein
MYHQRNITVAAAHNSTNCNDVDTTVFVIWSDVNRSRNAATNLYLNSLSENMTVHSLVVDMLRGERSRLIWDHTRLSVTLFSRRKGWYTVDCSHRKVYPVAGS